MSAREFMGPAVPTKPAGRTVRHRSDGVQSREAVLRAAVQLVTTTGLRDLSIGALAKHMGMSKSGLFGHFGSKAELELATIETAVQIYNEHVIEPAVKAKPGVARLVALTEAFLRHLEERVFPGGCFFAAVAAELDTRPGRARDRVRELSVSWMGLLEQCVREAQEAGEIDAGADTAQVAFEVDAMLALGNMAFIMTGDAGALGRAREGVRHVLERAKGARGG